MTTKKRSAGGSSQNPVFQRSSMHAYMHHVMMQKNTNNFFCLSTKRKQQKPLFPPWRQHTASRQNGMQPVRSHPHHHPRVRPIPVSNHEPPLSHTLDTPTDYSPPNPSHVTPHLLSVLTDMHAHRKAFRSLRSFTHAARHHSTPSEIVSDPIVDDDNLPTSEIHNSNPPHSPTDHILVHSPIHVQENQSNFNQVDSSNETRLYARNLAPQEKSPSVLSEPASMSPTRRNANKPTPKQSLRPRRGPTLAPASVEDITDDRPLPNKAQQVFDIEEVGRPLSPPIKRRRTRSSSRQNRQSSPSPEVDELHFRQLLDNAVGEERLAILAATGSSRGRRKLRKLLIDDDEGRMQSVDPPFSNPLKDGDVQWLGTSYDSVEEVAPTPSPQSKRKSHSDRPRRGTDPNRTPRRSRPTVVERIDTSESPERIVRRRSRRLKRDIKQAPATVSLERQVETVDSSSSPGPKKRRSRRLAKVAELPPEEPVGSDDSDDSDASEEIVPEKATDSKKAKKRKGASRSRPLPKPKQGELRERLRRRTPLLPRKMKPSRNARKKTESRIGDRTGQDSSGPRRSKRLRKSRATRASVFDVDADDEIIEEGSAESENEDDGSNFGAEEAAEEDEEIIVEEVEYEEDDEEGEVEYADGEDDEDGGDDDEDGDEDEDDFEEREWKEELKRKQIKRKQKRNGRRKRTRPRDVFRTEGEVLTAREQQERLDFLVEQSADIASHLHKAMGEAARGTGEASKNGDGGVPNSTSGDTGLDHPDGDGDVTRKKETFVPPSGPACELQPHQKDGIDWLLTLDSQGLNAILADEMGLGKTIQTVSFLASLVLSGSRGPHLVVAPKNVCPHWADEVRKWYPTELTVVTHLGNMEERLERLKHVLEEDNFDILVTSYDTAICDLFSRKRRDGVSWEHLQVLRAFRKVEFEYLVVDEAHRLKNDSTKTNRAIRNYDLAQRRLLLTGTPLSNDLKELWSLMNVLNPRIFSSKARFEEWFSAPFASKTKKHSNVSLTHAEQSVIVDRLHTVIRPFFRRRVRVDVCPNFTSADEVVIRCPLSGLQRAVLYHLQRRAGTNECGIRNVVMAMRAASNHPYIVSDALFDSEQSLTSEKLVTHSGKFVFLHFALSRLINSGHRVLIFSQFRRVLDLIEDLLTMLRLKFGRLDGETSDDDRTNGLAEFNREGSDIPVFLLTTRAGGIGLNLQTADTVILYDSDWNPSADLQAVSRIQRIGQKRTVHIMRLVAENSVDELMVETARHKLRTQNVAVGAGKFNTSMGAALDTRVRQRDLEELLKRLESQNYAEDQEDTTQGASQENGSPESLSPRRVSRAAQIRRFAEWGNQLLRKDESSLSSVDVSPIWIESSTGPSDNCIPPWLSKDADLESAVKALRCSDASAADRVYEESLLLKTNAGALSKKDRAIRARRQASVIDISDVDSEKDSGSDKETDRSNDDEWEVKSGLESDDDSHEEETVEEKLIPKKTHKRTGLYNAWSQRQDNQAAPRPADPVAVASSAINLSQAWGPSKPLQPAMNSSMAVQSIRTHEKNAKSAVHANREGDKSYVAAPKVLVPRLSAGYQRSGSSKQRVALPTAHLKRLPPYKPSPGSKLTVSKGRRQKKSATRNSSQIRNGVCNKEIRSESQHVTFVADSQQNVRRNENVLLSNAPSRGIPVNYRGSREPVTAVAYDPVQRPVFAPVHVLPPHLGYSAKGPGPALPVLDQRIMATTVPSVSQWGSHVDMRRPGFPPGSGHLYIQDKETGNGIAANRAKLSQCGIQPAPARTNSGARVTAPKRVTNPAPTASASRTDKSLQPIVVTAGQVELGPADDFSVTFWEESIGIETEQTVSMRPTSKRGRSPRIVSGKVARVSKHTTPCSVQNNDIQMPNRNPRRSSTSSPRDGAAKSVPSAKPLSADQFGKSVERLKEMTNVLDIQFLEDALLDCDCDVEAAKEMVLRQIS